VIAPRPLRLSPAHRHLLTACLGEGDVADTALVEWHAVVDLDDLDDTSFRLLPLLAHNLQAYDISMSGKIAGVARQAWVRNQLIVNRTAELLAMLQAAGVEAGADSDLSLAMTVYPVVGARHLGRVALVATAIGAATTVLMAEGWTVRRTDRHGRTELSSDHEPYLLLLPHHLAAHPQLDSSVAAGGRTIATETHAISVLEPTTATFVTMLRGLRPHRRLDLGWVADAILTMRREELDWPRFEELADAAQQGLRTSAALTWLRAEFAAQVPEDGIARLAGRVTAAGRARHAVWRRSRPGSGVARLLDWIRLG